MNIEHPTVATPVVSRCFPRGGSTVRRVVLLLIIFGITGAAGSRPLGAEPKLYDKVAAVVEDRVITVNQVLEQFLPLKERWQRLRDPVKAAQARKALYMDVLNGLIDDTLLDIEIENSRIQIGEQEVDEAVEGLMRLNNIPDLATFKRALEREGIVWGEYRERIRRQLKHKRYLSFQIGRQAKVEDEDVEAEYRLRQQKARQKITCDLQYIFIATGVHGAAAAPSRAARALAETTADNADFIAVGRRYDDSDSAGDGGLRRSWDVEVWVSPLQKVCIAGDPEKVFPSVVQLENGYAVAKLYARSYGELPPFEQMRESIYRDLFGQRVQKLTRNLLDRLRAKAYVKIVATDFDELWKDLTNKGL